MSITNNFVKQWQWVGAKIEMSLFKTSKSL